MQTFQINLIKAVKELKKRFPHRLLNCLETGTIRRFSDNHNSTLHISETLGDSGFLVSVDKSEDCIKESKRVCQNSSNVKWVLGDSISYLRQTKDKYHLIFLDTSNDKDFIFEEFRLAITKMVPNGILIVDDAGVTMNGEINPHTTRVKGHKVVAFLKSIGLTGFICKSPIGTQVWLNTTKVAITKIREGLENV